MVAERDGGWGGIAAGIGYGRSGSGGWLSGWSPDPFLGLAGVLDWGVGFDVFDFDGGLADAAILGLEVKAFKDDEFGGFLGGFLLVLGLELLLSLVGA